MLEFEVGPIVVDGTPSKEWEVLLKLNARFCVRVDGFTVVDEPSFPIVELAKAMMAWDFGDQILEYRSLESEISPLMLCAVAGGYYIASPMSRTCGDAIVAREQVESTIKQFIENVHRTLKTLGLDHFI